MKSVSEMIRFLNRCFSTDKRSRRSGVRSASGVSGPEVMEARLLLAADLGEALFNPLVLAEVGEGQGLDSYFVTFDTAQDTTVLAQTTGASSVTASEYVDNGYTLDFDQGLTIQAAADTFVLLPGFEYLHPNVAVQYSTRAVPNDPLYGNQWHLNNTGQTNGTAGADANVEAVWDNYTGLGVTIGIIDDGLEVGHEDLVKNVNTTIDYDWNGNDGDPSPGALDFHGTAVAGVAAARGNNGVGVTGAAWNSELVGLRLIAGPVTDQDQAEALTRAPDTIDVYNNSWGTADNGRISSIGPQALAALEQAATTGRGGLGNIHTWAGGNGGNATNDNVNYDPYANSRFTIAVGAITNTGVRATYSDPGASLIVTAYSNGGTLGITTTDRTGATGYATGNYTNTFGGTSSATPLVSGIIALMLEANPYLTYRDVTDILVHTSERVDAGNADWVQNGAGLWVNHEYGFGGIDATAAVNAALIHAQLGPELTYSTPIQNVNQAIPDAGAGSVSQSVSVVQADAVSLEYVEVVLNATHTFIGDLEVVLTSPSGTRSVLAETRTQDGTDNYNNWVFSSARHWDESSEGDWTLTVTDGAAGTVGTLDSFQINFYGTDIDVPPPAAPQIVAPLGPTGDTTPTIQWTNVPNGATYNLEVLDSNGAVVVSQQALTGTVFTAPTLVQGNYQVRVQAVNVENEAGPFSQPAAFTVDVPEPLQPQIVSPTGIIQDLSPLAEWSRVGGTSAVSYNLQVSDLSGNVVVQETGIVQTSFQLPQLLQATYLIQVQGVNEVGETSAFSIPVSFQIDFPDPPKPVIISPSVDATADAQPDFRWSTVDATTSTLWVGKVRSGTGTPQVPAVYDRIIYVTEHYRGSYTWFSQLPGEGTYAAWVQNFNSIGERSPWSDPEIFTLAVPTPQPPVLASIGTTEDLTPTITWDAQTFGHSYQLWVNNLSTGQARAIHELDLVGVNSFTTADNLTQGRYRAWVQATNAVGEKGAWSSSLTFDVDLLPAGRPTVTGPVTVDADGNTRSEAETAKPVFTWTAVNNGDTYELWVNHIESGTTRIVHERGLSTTNFTPTTNLPQGTYKAWVRAFNYAGEVGEWSSAYTFFLDVPTPGTPTIVEPLRNGVGSVENPSPTIVWTTLDPAESYHLQFEVVNTGELLIDTTGITEQRFTIPLLLPETRYRTRVRGENSVGELGEWSDWYDVTIDVPNATTPVAYGPVGTITEKDNRVTFEWQHSADSVSYQILVRDLLREESIAIQVTVSELDIVNNISISTHTLQDGTYRFWVRAFNSEGTASGWSNSQAFIVDANFASLDTKEQDQGLEIALTSLQPTQNDEVEETAERPGNLGPDAGGVVSPVSEGDEQSQIVVPASDIPAALHDVVETVMAEFADPSMATVFGDGNNES